MTRRVDFHDLPNIDPDQLQPIDIEALTGPDTALHAARILISERVEGAEDVSRRVNQVTR